MPTNIKDLIKHVESLADTPFESLEKARIDEGKSIQDKKAARDERASSWERKDYGMHSGNSKIPEIRSFLHRAKLNQIKETPKPNLPKSEPIEKIDKIGKYGTTTNQGRGIRTRNETGINKPYAVGTGGVGISGQGYTVRGGMAAGLHDQSFRHKDSGGAYDRDLAKEKAKKVLSEMKAMPKPNLTRTEEPMDKSIEDQMFYEKHRKQVHAQGKARRQKMEQSKLHPGIVTKLSQWFKAKTQVPITAEAPVESKATVPIRAPADLAAVSNPKDDKLAASEKTPVVMPAKEAVEEHKHLVNVLRSPSHKDDLKEAKKQGGELKEYQEKLDKTVIPFKKPVKSGVSPQQVKQQNAQLPPVKPHVPAPSAPVTHVSGVPIPHELNEFMSSGVSVPYDHPHRELAAKFVTDVWRRNKAEGLRMSQNLLGFDAKGNKTVNNKEGYGTMKAEKKYAAPTPSDVSAPVIINPRRTNTGRHVISGPDMIVGYPNGASPSGGPQPKEKKPMKKSELAKSLKKAMDSNLEKANRFETHAGMGTKEANSNKAIAVVKAHIRANNPAKIAPVGVHGAHFMADKKTGTSEIGARMSPGGASPKTNSWAKGQHEDRLSQLKSMPKPNLPKSELIDKSGGYEEGVHQRSIIPKRSTTNMEDKSSSSSGDDVRSLNPYNTKAMGNAKSAHRMILSKLKSMPKPNLPKSEENPDLKSDANLGEKVESLVENHMLDNKQAERKEGHEIIKSQSIAKIDPKSHLPGTMLDKSAPEYLAKKKALRDGLSKCYGSKLMKDSAVTNTSDTGPEKLAVRANIPKPKELKVKATSTKVSVGSIPGMPSPSTMGKSEENSFKKNFKNQGLTPKEIVLAAKARAEKQAIADQENAVLVASRRKMKDDAILPENIKLDSPKYLTVDQHFDSTINGKPNPIREKGQSSIQHIDDLKALNQYHGRNQIKGVHNQPVKEWGSHTYLLHPTGQMEYQHSDTDSSDSSATKRGMS